MILPMWERLKVIGQTVPQLPMIPPVVIVNLIIDNNYKLSKKDWQFEQGADPEIGVIMDLMVHNKKCDKNASRGVQILWKLRNQLEFKNGLLYRKVFSKRQGKHIYQFVMPEKFGKGHSRYAMMIMVIWGKTGSFICSKIDISGPKCCRM